MLSGLSLNLFPGGGGFQLLMLLSSCDDIIWNHICFNGIEYKLMIGEEVTEVLDSYTTHQHNIRHHKEESSVWMIFLSGYKSHLNCLA